MKRALDSEVLTSTHPKKKRTHVAVPEAPFFDFEPLIENEQELRKHAKRNSRGEWVIDFSSRDATLALTCAILKHHFQLSLTLPTGHLVPTIPNRVQYISWAATLLGADGPEKPLVVLDIGTGPSCIYPMLASRMYPQWSFIGSDSDREAVEAATRNCENNSLSCIKIIHTDSNSFFPETILKLKPALTLCNPPFHEILPDTDSPAGTDAQLKTDGGELAYLSRMAVESRSASVVKWFTSLIGRKRDLPKFVAFLRSNHVRAPFIRTAELSQGGRTTRWAVAWSFGDEPSIVRILSNSNTTWRCSIQVKPGRKYANHLECQDIVDIACSACQMLGWERLPPTQVNSNQETVVLIFSDQEEQGAVELLVDCLPQSPSGEFELILKVNRKGPANSEFVQELGKSVSTKMSTILNESVS